jgi:transcriptional regulator with XRE-family HTH domain
MDKVKMHSILENALRAWRIERIQQGQNYSLDEFAGDLGVSRSVVSMWLNQKQSPNYQSIVKIAPALATILGPQVYDELGLARPDEDATLRRITELSKSAPPEHRAELERIIVQWLEDNGFKRVGP